MREAVTAVVVIACLVGASGIARARDEARDAGARERAAEHFSRGELLFDAGEYQRAAEAFSKAHELAPHPSVLANIATSYERAGMFPEAVGALGDYLASLRATGEKDAKAERRFGKLLKKVGEIAVECPQVACTVRVDGTERGETPLSVFVNPGTHRVEAASEGREVSAFNTRVRAGETSTVELFPEATGEDVGDASRSDDGTPAGDEGSALRTSLWVLAGVTGAAGATTLVFGMRTLNDKEELDRLAPGDDNLEAVKERGERDRLITNIMIGVTGAAAATALVLGLVELAGSGEDGDETVRLVPGPGAGIGLEATF